MAPSERMPYGNRAGRPAGPGGPVFLKLHRTAKLTKQKLFIMAPSGRIQYGNINLCVACTKSDSVSIRRSLACISFNHGRLCTRVLRCVHGCRRAKRAQVHRGEAEMHLLLIASSSLRSTSYLKNISCAFLDSNLKVYFRRSTVSVGSIARNKKNNFSKQKGAKFPLIMTKVRM